MKAIHSVSLNRCYKIIMVIILTMDCKAKEIGEMNLEAVGIIMSHSILDNHSQQFTENVRNRDPINTHEDEDMNYKGGSICNMSQNEIIDYQVVANSEKSLKAKETTKATKRKITCKVCKKEIVSKNYARHMLIHKGVKKFACEICNKAFLQKSDLISHLKIHMGIKDFKCHLCQKEFNRKSDVKRHMTTHPGQKDFKCHLCSKEFTLNTQLKQHLQLIHLNIKDFACDRCGKAFKRKTHLTAHLKIHTQVKDFQCHLCGKEFKRKEHLKSHMRTHAGVQEFKCNVCSEPFSQESDLNKHLSIHVNRSDFCELNGEYFPDVSCSNSNTERSSKAEKLKCTLCGKKFTYDVNLKLHMSMHDLNKQYNCNTHNSRSLELESCLQMANPNRDLDDLESPPEKDPLFIEGESNDGKNEMCSVIKTDTAPSILNEVDFKCHVKTEKDSDDEIFIKCEVDIEEFDDDSIRE